jgi:hypothetical protein
MEPLDNIDGASLTRRLREDALQKRAVIVASMMVGAFARKKETATN